MMDVKTILEKIEKKESLDLREQHELLDACAEWLKEHPSVKPAAEAEEHPHSKRKK